MPGRAFLALCTAIALAFAGGCSSSTVGLRSERTGAIQWTPCKNVQCGRLTVPLDAKRPDGPQITLALARRPATHKRIGVLFTNPGGPGGSGVDFLQSARSVFRSDILDNFDIVSWDPRGVGDSAPVQCTPNLDGFYAVDRDPQTAAAVATNVDAARSFVASCAKQSGSELPFVSTADTVRDMDAIRAAMGENTISYFGFSYGTLIGAMYAAAYPEHVRAMVLDGAVDPSLATETVLVDQARGFEQQLDAFFQWCQSNSDCGFATGGDPAAAFDHLVEATRAETIPAKVGNEPRTLGPGEFDIGVASALYGGESSYPDLGAALAQTARGLGDKLLKFADSYTGRQSGGRYSSETAALYATSCLDAPAPRTIVGVEQDARAAEKAAPRMGPATVWLSLPCTYWPVLPTGKIAPVHAPKAPPIVVVGNTHDPATPYKWAQGLARQLGTATLLTYQGGGHTAYGRDGCIDQNVDDYLVKLTVPATGTTC
jgi:pimeloyl-ACP methyl ester carboxylesterase